MAKTIYTMWKRCEADYAALPAVRWLVKKNVQERSYGELAAAVTAIRKGFAAQGFAHTHIALIGLSSANWIEAYMAVVTSNNAAVPMDAGLPAEDIIDLVFRSDSEGVFLDEKFAALVPLIKANCPKVRKIWMLSGEAVEGTETVADLKAEGEGHEEPEPPAEEDVSMIVYTSGTTGKARALCSPSATCIPISKRFSMTRIRGWYFSAFCPFTTASVWSWTGSTASGWVRCCA